jgi:hypothetical protein
VTFFPTESWRHGTLYQAQCKCQNSERFQESLQKTQGRNGDSHIAGVRVGVKMEVWRTTGCRHFLRGPSGTTGSSSTRTRTSTVNGLDLPDVLGLLDLFGGLHPLEDEVSLPLVLDLLHSLKNIQIDILGSKFPSLL